MDRKDENSQDDRKGGGMVDTANNLYSTAKNIQQTAQTIQTTVSTAVRAAPILANPYFWVGVAILLIIIFIVFFTGGGGGAGGRRGGGGGSGSQGGAPGPGSGAVCGGTGSLDYTIPVYDTSVVPPNPEETKQLILASWPNAQIQNYETIVEQSVANGWNPSFLLTLWTEESGAQGVQADDPLGCLLPENIGLNDINKSLSCFFHTFPNKDKSFEDIMCTYGGDNFSNAPCTFTRVNPNFPGGIKSWYGKIAGSVPTLAECPQVSGGGWPTTGVLTQGPLGAFDHADLKSRTGWDSIDIGTYGPTNGGGPAIFTPYDGVVIEAHSCVLDNTCSVHYGNYVLVSVNNGEFTAMYGHLSQINVVSGQAVKTGDQLGIMGTTGNSTGVHLHWEFRGADMTPPRIPEPISPLDCDIPGIPCSPASISPTNAGV